MAKKWFTSHGLEEDEMPYLTNSDSSPSGYPPGDLSLSDDENSHTDFNDEPIVQRRHTDEVDRSNRSSSIVPSPPPRQERRERSRSRPRSSSRARSRSRAISTRTKFSYSRRASLGGNTIYRTPHMAMLDTHLRSTSGLRLQTDGTCNFLFEQQRFVIETTEETGDFLFYASFGLLNELQRAKGPKHLLRLLALWNEELKQRGGAGGDAEGQEVSGLLRIDSSKAEGPHVAFIYYGHIDKIQGGQHFQDTMDEFVDDALGFAEKLTAVKQQQDPPERAVMPVVKNQSMLSHSSSPKFKRSVINMPSPSSSPKFKRDAMNHPKKAIQTEEEEPETATLAATSSNGNVNINTSRHSVLTKMMSSLRSKSHGNGIGSRAFSDPSNSTCAFVVDKNAAEEGKIKPTINLSRLGMLKREDGSSFYNRLGDSVPVKGKSFHADDDFGTEGNKSSNDNKTRDSHPKKGKSFHAGDEKYADGNKSIDDNKARDPYARKGKSFHFGDDNCADGNKSIDDSKLRDRYPRKGRSFHGGDNYNADGYNDAGARHSRRSHRKVATHVEDDYDNSHNDGPHAGYTKPHYKGTHFTADDSHGRNHHPRRPKSFHSDNNYNRKDRPGPKTSTTNRAGIHADQKRSNIISKETDEYEKLNQSINIYDQPRFQAGGGEDTRFLQSEPVCTSRRHQGNGDYPAPPSSSRDHSRRHWSAASQHSRRRQTTKRHSAEGRPTSKSGHHNHSSRHQNTDGRLNQSEPVLSQHRNFLPPPPPLR